MKRTLILAFAVGACSLASAQWSFYGPLGSGSSFLPQDMTPNGGYAAGSVGTNIFRWTAAGGSETVTGGQVQEGTVTISADGQRIAAGVIGADSKRHGGFYDYGTNSWTAIDQPTGFHLTGLDNVVNSIWGMDDSGNVLALGSYDSNLRLKPTVYNAVTGTHIVLPTVAAGGTVAHSRPNSISGDGTTVVGWDSEASTRRAAVWKNGAQVYYDAAAASEVTGTNTDGSLYFGFRSNQPVWWDGDFNVTTLGVPTGFNRGAVTSGTDDGRIMVGYAQNGITVSTRRAIIWIDGEASLLSSWALANGMDTSSIIMTTGLYISPDGNSISGWGSGTAGGQLGFIMTNPVPEPATIGALVLGIGALVRRRRKK